MNISFFEISDFEKNKFMEAFPDDNLFFSKDTIQDVDLNLYKNSDVVCTFIYSKLSTETLSMQPNLKLICTRSTGTDHIDTDYCDKHKIAVKNVPLYGENTVAEHTIALILSLSRKIHKSYIYTISGEFSTDGLQGFDLKDKTIGIIGGGRIGLHVAKIAKSFGMHVRIYDIRQDNFLAGLIGFKYYSLEEIFKYSDIISLHVPLNEHTKHMINENTLSLFKKGALLINTARGELIDTPVLVEALSNGTLSGVGLDVIEGEELLIEENIFDLPIEKANNAILSSKQLLENENVVLTPHNAFNSIEATSRIVETTINNINDIRKK